MKNKTMTTMRNHRLRRACREEMERRNTFRAADVIDTVVSGPVPRGFFVSVDHAIEMDRKHRNGKLPPLSPLKSGMWDEIFAAADTIQRKKRMTRTDAICYVIARSTASRFYLSRDEALKICRTITPDNEDDD